MKKSFSIMMGLAMMAGGAHAAPDDVVIDLDTPVRWYAQAIRLGYAGVLRGNGYSTENLEQVNQVLDALFRLLPVTDGIVTISPADLTEKCLAVCHDDDAVEKCADGVLASVREHNKLVAQYTPERQVSMARPDEKITWTFMDYYAPMTTVFGTEYSAFFAPFNDYMVSVNYQASLNDIMNQCQIILRDTQIARRVNASLSTCQTYADQVAKNHNSNASLYSTESIITE